jgi:hypothetical protein
MAGYLSKKGVYISATDAVSLSGYLKADGTVPLTADWNVGAFDLTCVDMNATNFKLSGVGTLTSALGNVSLTTALTAASGNEAALSLNYTTNKAAGDDYGLVVNRTEDTASPGTSYLLDLRNKSVSEFSVAEDGSVSCGTINNGSIYASSNIRTMLLNAVNNNLLLTINARDYITASTTAITACTGTFSQTSGTNVAFSFVPTYNQTSGTARNTDLLINRTETAVGSGTQRLISGQVGSTERVGFDNKGFEVRSYPLTPTHDTATPLFGITIPAGSTAGGVITYTLNVTDDDGSDDQIEVGTVQFCGLQDEANWHTNISEVSTQAVESGTLATTWAIDTATANTLKVTLQATSNLTSPVYTLSYTVTWNNAYTVTTY